jgi:hypothetical protein
MPGLIERNVALSTIRFYGIWKLGQDFLFPTSSRQALRPTQPHTQWVPGVERPGRETDHSPLQLVQRSRKCGSTYPLPHTPSWRSA